MPLSVSSSHRPIDDSSRASGPQSPTMARVQSEDRKEAATLETELDQPTEETKRVTDAYQRHMLLAGNAVARQLNTGYIPLAVDTALATPLPGHPDGLLNALETSDRRTQRSAEPAAASGPVHATQQAAFEEALAGQMDNAIDQVAEWLKTLHSPILQPSALIGKIIEQRIREYQQRTGTAENLSPQSLIKVVYKEAQSANPNTHITAAVKQTKWYTLKEIVTGTYLNDLRQMRDKFGQGYKVVSVEHQPLVSFIGRDVIEKHLKTNLEEYQRRPGLEAAWLSFYEVSIRNAAFDYLAANPVSHPGHALMTDFFTGKRQAAQVMFHGVPVNGVFAITQGQTAIMCSVDDNKCFYIGEKVNSYWHLGTQQREPVPAYPTDPQFKEWIGLKLPLIDQLKAAGNPKAFELISTQFSTNAQIGWPRHGGRANVKPFTFEPSESINDLSRGFYDSNMRRIKSDMDTLIFTNWEHFGLEALGVIKELLNTGGYLTTFIAPGTGSLLSKALVFGMRAGVSAASSGVNSLIADITDDPAERDTAQRQAAVSLAVMAVQVVMPAVMKAASKLGSGLAVADDFASKVGYHRFAKLYIQSTMPRVLKEVAAKRFGAGAGRLPKGRAIENGASGRAASALQPWPVLETVVKAGANPSQAAKWSQLGDVERGQYLSSKLLNTNVGRRLAQETSVQSVSQQVKHNLHLASADASKSPLKGASERVEINRARDLLDGDATRLEAKYKFLRQLGRQPLTVQTREVNGVPEHAAASWVAASSSVKVPEGRIRQVIDQFRNADLNQMSTFDAIYQAMFGTPAGAAPVSFRPSGVEGLMGSDIAYGAFENGLDSFAIPAGMSRADWLFALTQTLQPFPNNNDPVARVFYALAYLQDTNNNGFKALVKATEPQLAPPVTVVTKIGPQVPRIAVVQTVVDTRTEPLRQIDVNPSRQLPPAMQGFMDQLRRDPKLEKAFTAPAGECAKTSEIVGQFMQAHGFENIKYRAMLIWSSRNPDGVFNHFFLVGDFEGKTYAFDLTAPRFENKGMPSLMDPLILPEPALMRAYQDASAKALIKYKDFSNLRSAETAFSDFSAPGPRQFIEGGYVLTPGWSRPAVSPAGKVPSVTRIRAEDIATHHAKKASGVIPGAMQMRRASTSASGMPPLVAPSQLSATEQSRQAIQRSLPLARVRLDAAIRTVQTPERIDETKRIARLFYGSDSPETIKALLRNQQLMKADLDQLKMDNIDFIQDEDPGWSAQLQPSNYANYKAGSLNEKYIEINVAGALEYYRDMGSSDVTLANTLIHEMSHGMPGNEDFVYAGKLRGAREDIVDLLNLGKSTNPKEFRYLSGDVEDGTVSLFASSPQKHNADSTLFVTALLDQASNNRPLFEANMISIENAVAQYGGGLIKDTVAVRIIDKRSAPSRSPPAYLLAVQDHTGRIAGVFRKAPECEPVRWVDCVRDVFRWQ